MKFIKDVPNITVLKDNQEQFEIKSVQEFDEHDDRVYLKCAEYVKDFKRGFTCDFVTNNIVADENGEPLEWVNDDVKDLVLVYVNKNQEVTSMPQYEYVFYK